MGTNPGHGWMMSLRDDEESEWGDVNEFYESFADGEHVGDGIELDCSTWGKVHSGELMPRSGDGIAFYHNTRARFPDDDPHPRQPRVSLVGRLLDVQTDGRKVVSFRVVIEPAVLKALRRNPIIRDESTKHLFVACGMVPGAVSTFFHISPDVWSEIYALVETRVAAVAARPVPRKSQ